MTNEDSAPRLYTSFADFERDELRRHGLEAWPLPAPPIVIQPRVPVEKVARRPTAYITPTSLRAEGILEIGCAHGTSVLFVRTQQKLHLLHVSWLPERQLDAYAVKLAVVWIDEHGLPSCKVARNLGVHEKSLRTALTAAGYERLSKNQHQQYADARGARKFGNRRGRLVRSPGTDVTP